LIAIAELMDASARRSMAGYKAIQGDGNRECSNDHSSARVPQARRPSCRVVT
jgi:hypothetical protein